ncbi:MAG: precorrin-8X methylmutase [Peptococcaceae bacterium]
MSFNVDPRGIETRSMEIIADIVGPRDWAPLEKAIIYRVIHTTGDPNYADRICLHPQALTAGQNALKSGCRIITDVEMVNTGINKNALHKLGIKSRCFLNEPRVRETAKQTGETRSMTAFKLAGQQLDNSIIAIGNAPTALFTLLELCKSENIRPALIIGVPVGFVGAAESKDLLVAESPVPFITVKGTKGGSPVAAAVVNAFLYSLVERND